MKLLENNIYHKSMVKFSKWWWSKTIRTCLNTKKEKNSMSTFITRRKIVEFRLFSFLNFKPIFIFNATTSQSQSSLEEWHNRQAVKCTQNLQGRGNIIHHKGLHFSNNVQGSSQESTRCPPKRLSPTWTSETMYLNFRDRVAPKIRRPYSLRGSSVNGMGLLN